MRFYFVVFLFLGVAFNAKASSVCKADSLNDIRIEQHQILCHQNIVGKVKMLPTKSNDSNINNYKIQIFEKKGRLVAEYDIQMLNKHKKNQDAILAAKVKTIKDNVTHNGSNFLDFNVKRLEDSRDSIFQLEKVVEYLMTYNYL